MKIVSTLIVWAAFVSAGWAAEAEFFLRGDDRVVFLGDSITEQKLYTSFIEAYTVTRFPKQTFHFWNSGWGGDTAWLRMRSHIDEKALFAAKGDDQQKLVEKAVDTCLNRDVVSYKPTVVFVNFGMNDHNYEPFREDIFAAYVRSQTEIVQVLVKAGARVVLLTPQPIEERRAHPDQDPRNQSLRRFANGLKDVAGKHKALFVDQFDPYLDILLREHAAHADVNVGGGDAVHPSPIGHTLMAWIILKQLKAPSLISRAELDVTAAPDKMLVQSQQCAVSNIRYANGVLAFERADDALPMPIDPRANDALKLGPILNDLNRYELKVAGLSADRYDVMIDGALATTLTKEELSKGANLSISAGPIMKQAQDVLALINKKHEIGGKLWSVQIRPRLAAQKPGLEKQIADLEAEIAAACQPKPRQFELRPAGK